MYTIIDDRLNNLMIINDCVFSSDEFLNAYDKYINNCFSYLTNSSNQKRNKTNYDILFNETQQYETQNHPCSSKNSFHSGLISPYCTTCSLKTTTVPKSGYNTKGYVLTIKKISDSAALIFSNSDEFVVALAKKLGITVAKAATIKAKLVALGIVVGMYIVGNRTVKQYTHKICYKAIKEQEIIKLQDKKGKKKDYSKTATRYYYNARP